jgi:translation initiation factor 3 subunit H
MAGSSSDAAVAEKKVDVVELDGMVVLKIIKHCQEALPSFVTGQLLGLDIGRTLEVTNCFPFPNKNDEQAQAAPAAGGDGEDGDEDGAEYQMEMMRCLREVNVDNNTVGWYQSTYFSSFIDDSCIETQFNYQENIKNCVVIIYDPSRTRTTGLALRAFRLTDTFMALYKEGKFTFDSLATAHMANADVFQELQLKVRNSHLSSALLLELQDECNINANAADFSRLELHTNPFLEKQMQLLIECVDDLQQESSKLQHFDRNQQRQKSAQQAYLLKKKQEAQARLMRGEEALPEEDLSQNNLFKPLPQPSRLESLLIANQMEAYCQQINQFTGQSFAKLFLMQSLNNGTPQ